MAKLTDKQSEILYEPTMNTKEDGNQIREGGYARIDPTELDYLKTHITIELVKVKETDMNERDTLPQLFNPN